MPSFTFRRAVPAAFAYALVLAPSFAQADIKDYHFEILDKSVATGPDREIAVRLLNAKTGRPVPGAVIFAERLDMAPEGMAEMTSKISPLAASSDGTYHFKVALPMAGGWRLSLGAKVQGEEGSITDELTFKAGE